MMNSKLLKTYAAIVALLGAPAVLAHMEMVNPPPLGSQFNKQNNGPIDYDMKAPMPADGSKFPCRGHLQQNPKSVVTYQAGQQYNMELQGSATHEGGSCQFSLSYDNGKTFQVIKSIIGGCPLAKGYDFTIPQNAPSGEALFAWSWFNKVGVREMYMNCAAVTIQGNSNTPFDGPAMFVANIQGQGDCKTVEKQEIVFPQPGSVVEYGGMWAGQTPASNAGQCSYPGGSSSGSSGGGYPSGGNNSPGGGDSSSSGGGYPNSGGSNSGSGNSGYPGGGSDGSSGGNSGSGGSSYPYNGSPTTFTTVPSGGANPYPYGPNGGNNGSPSGNDGSNGSAGNNGDGSNVSGGNGSDGGPAYPGGGSSSYPQDGGQPGGSSDGGYPNSNAGGQGSSTSSNDGSSNYSGSSDGGNYAQGGGDYSNGAGSSGSGSSNYGSGSSSTGGSSAGGCGADGTVTCSSDGKTWSMCSNGVSVQMGVVPPGTNCKNGVMG